MSHGKVNHPSFMYSASRDAARYRQHLRVELVDIVARVTLTTYIKNCSKFHEPGLRCACLINALDKSAGGHELWTKVLPYFPVTSRSI